MTSILFRNALTLARAPARAVTRRNIVTTPVRKSSDPLIGHIEQEARAGGSLPFSITNRYKLAAIMILYFGSGFSIPFVVVRYQLLKKSS